jgi:hypothetical protein
MQPLGGHSLDGNQTLALLRERLDGFIVTGQKIIQNYPHCGQKVLEQLTSALNDVAMAGKFF